MLADQFGFRPSGSTQCAVINMLHHVTAMLENCDYVRYSILKSVLTGRHLGPYLRVLTARGDRPSTRMFKMTGVVHGAYLHSPWMRPLDMGGICIEHPWTTTHECDSIGLHCMSIHFGVTRFLINFLIILMLYWIQSRFKYHITAFAMGLLKNYQLKLS